MTTDEDEMYYGEMYARKARFVQDLSHVFVKYGLCNTMEYHDDKSGNEWVEIDITDYKSEPKMGWIQMVSVTGDSIQAIVKDILRALE